MVFGLQRKSSASSSDVVDELYLMVDQYRSEIQELREFIAQFDNVPCFFETDTHIMRFLKASNMSVKSAKQMLQTQFECVQQRENVGLEKLSVSWIKKQYPHGWHGICKSGRPVYIECLGKLNISKLFEEYSMEQIIQFLLLDTENSMRYRYPICSLSGKMISDSTMIFDLRGVSLSMCTDRRIHELLRRLMKVAHLHFPESSGRILVCRAPLAFSALWSVIKHLLPQGTSSRVHVHSDLGPLFDWVEKENVPLELGGTSGREVTEDNGPWCDERHLRLLASISLSDVERAVAAGTTDELWAHLDVDESTVTSADPMCVKTVAIGISS